MYTKIKKLIILLLFTPLLTAQNMEPLPEDSVAMEPLKPSELYDDESSDIKFFGDYYIGVDRTVKDNIRVIGGDLYVAGTVDGKIIVLGGDVFLESTAVVNGQIVAIGGSIERKPGTIVNGKIVEASIKKGITFSEGSGKVVVPETGEFELEDEYVVEKRSWVHPKVFWFVYNRNEGLLLTPFNFSWDNHGKSSFRLSLSLGYRFATKSPAGRLTFEKSFFKHKDIVIYASLFKQSRTDDWYRMPEWENSLATFLGRQDFYDRWDESGYECGVGLDFARLKLKLQAVHAEQDTISVYQDVWSLFEKDRLLRENLSFEPMNIDYFAASLSYQTKDYHPLTTGFAFHLNFEWYQAQSDNVEILPENKSKFKERHWGFLKINWEFSPGLVVRSQLIAGTSKGVDHEHRLFGVGGLGSVSAFPYKIQTGDQFTQANVELVFTPDFLEGNWFFKLFADAGYAWWKSDHSFDDIDTILSNGISSAGIGIGIPDDDGCGVGFNLARSLDGQDHWESTVRLNFNF